MQEHLRQLLSDELERCKPWIEAALGRSMGTHAFADIAAATYTGDMQLWPGPDAAMVTEIATFPRKKVVHVIAAGGSMAGVKALQEQVAEWGKSIGCDMITATGRKGWTRVFDHTRVDVILSRDL